MKVLQIGNVNYNSRVRNKQEKTQNFTASLKVVGNLNHEVGSSRWMNIENLFKEFLRKDSSRDVVFLRNLTSSPKPVVTGKHEVMPGSGVYAVDANYENIEMVRNGNRCGFYVNPRFQDEDIAADLYNTFNYLG